MDIPIPTLIKIISYQFLLTLLEGTNHEQTSQNNQPTWCFSLKHGEFFSKKCIHGMTKLLWGGYSKWEN